MSLANETKEFLCITCWFNERSKVMDVMTKTSANLPGVQTPDLCMYK